MRNQPIESGGRRADNRNRDKHNADNPTRCLALACLLGNDKVYLPEHVFDGTVEAFTAASGDLVRTVSDEFFEPFESLFQRSYPLAI